jgi:hypothetical protein
MVACSASCSGLELENLNLNLLFNTRNRRSDYVRVAVGPWPGQRWPWPTALQIMDGSCVSCDWATSLRIRSQTFKKQLSQEPQWFRDSPA